MFDHKKMSKFIQVFTSEISTLYDQFINYKSITATGNSSILKPTRNIYSLSEKCVCEVINFNLFNLT